MLNEQEQKLQNFIDEHVAKVEPMADVAQLACWTAYTDGTDENWAKAEETEKTWELVYTSPEDYSKLVGFQESGEINDHLLKRQLHVLVQAYKGNQIPEELLGQMIAKGAEVKKLRNNYRPEVDGKKLSRNDMEEVFVNSTDSEERKKIWEAQKSVGPAILEPLMDLVRLRNKAAKHLGYDNFYAMRIDLQDLDMDWLMGTFDQLYEMTETSFVKAKAEVDAVLRERMGVTEVMPWHYIDAYFQECPRVSDFDFNTYFGKKDIIPVVQRFYAGIGLNIEDVLARSDLFKREGKSEHAFSFDLDRKGDGRILMNITNTLKNMDTLLHECGHAVYDKGVERTLPWLLREPTHIFTTEAVAMMFGGMAYSGKWMQSEYGLSDEEAKMIEGVGFDLVKKQQLIFSRWCQVMLRFEKAMYEDPDQDLNQLWWDLAEKYQHVKKPEGRDMPDFATKDHIASVPVYYHNYQLGELMATQVMAYIMANVTNGEMFNGKPEVGQYMVEKIFKPGARLEWNELIKQATGEGLNPKFFAERYV